MAELLAGLEQTLSRNGRSFLLVGEPGIGKTRLAEEFARQASERDGFVLWGHGWDESSEPFSPWRQMIRQGLSHPRAREVVAQLGLSRHDLAIVVPEAVTLIDGEDEGAPLPKDPAQARLRTFDSIASFFEILSRFTLPILIIDNLQACDIPSLRLLRFISTRPMFSRPMIVGLYDDAALGQDPARCELIGGLSAEMVRIALAGLAQDDLARLFADAAGVPVSREEAAAILALSGGNPLFALELAHAGYRTNELGARGASPPILSNAFRAALRRHLSPLGDSARRILSIASVIGREFDRMDLFALAQVPEESIVYSLDQALKAHLLIMVDEEMGKVQFHHALLRAALHDDLDAMEKARLHVRWGNILIRRCSEGFPFEPSELAYHFQRGIAAGSAPQTVEYAYRAAVVADSRLAYEEAERFYAIALQALRDVPPNPLRCELLIGRGTAQLRAGNFLEARDTLLAAAHLADRIGAFELEARAALMIADRNDVHFADAETVTILRRLGEVRSGLSHPIRAAVLGGLARASRHTTPQAYREQLIAEAMEAAHESGEPRAMLNVFNSRRDSIWEVDNLSGRLDDTASALRLARECGDREAAVFALRLRAIDEIEAGEIATAREDIVGLVREAKALRQPFHVWEGMTMEAGLALLEGRFADAEEIANRAATLGNAIVPYQAMYAFSGQFGMICRERGRLQEVETGFRAHAQSNPDNLVFRATAAYVSAELGRHDNVRAEFEYLVRDDFGALARCGIDYLYILAVIGEICCYLEDRPRGETLYRLLAPFAERNVTFLGLVSLGSAATYLGKLATMLGRFDAAIAHFERAIEFNRRIDARPWLAETQYEFARCLQQRGNGSDSSRARELLREARSLAETIGSVRLCARIAAIEPGRAPDGVVPTPIFAAGAITRSAVLRRSGNFWSIEFEGRSSYLKNCKGVEHLAELLSYPDHRFRASMLATAGLASAANSRFTKDDVLPAAGIRIANDLGDAGEAIDRVAEKQYRRRIAELQEELAIAKSSGDLDRGMRAEAELDALKLHLRKHLGLKGRLRVDHSANERARVNVTRAIRKALKILNIEQPELAAELGKAISTGAECFFTSGSSTIAWRVMK